MDPSLIYLKQATFAAARTYYRAVTEWFSTPQSAELGRACAAAAEAYRDRLYDQLSHLQNLPPSEYRDEEMVRTTRLIELISSQIETGFEW